MEQMHWNILDLANQLRQERLFVNSEQQQLQNLNEKVLCASSRLAQLAWVTAQQRDNLNRLIVARPDCTPAACCQKANAIEATDFVDAYKVLGFQESLAYGELLSNLCTSPQLLASCLVVGDRLLPPECMTKVVHSVYTGLLSSSLLPEDKLLALKLLRHLTELQLVPSDNPRRLLRQKSCAFARLYSEFHEGLFSAKLFLTAALHKPIMQLLMEDEFFLDIDPDKATVRFPAEERLKRFGQEGTPEHAAQLAEYRKWTINCLVRVTNRFVSSICENMHCFPSSVRWLVRQIAGLLSQTGSIEPKEVHAICTDLIFNHFICPAIVNPEPYGITDAPISYIARFNLIQVAQIVQTLAMTRYEEVSSKVADLYSHFEKDCVSSILDTMLDGVGTMVNEEPAIIEGGKLQGLVRSCALFTEQELHNFIHFLQSVASSEADDTVDKKQLRSLLVQLPTSITTTVNGHSSQSTTTPSKLTPPQNDMHKRSGLLGKVSRNRTSSAPASPGRADASDDGGLDEEVLERASQDVLLIPFGSSASENVGFLSEQKVLCGDDERCPPQDDNLPNGVDVTSVGANSVERSESQEKRTRFSLLHDEGSIGNTSDNLEAVSEAASNHSVASSLELENEDQNDNLSDMVSANVSGRGTPNISGRDTPSSQITEGEEGPGGVLRGAAGEVRQSLDFHSTAQNKQSRSDIDDKFGKFEIKKLLEGDETVSMVSDTWSTDVLASDSETIEQSERSFPSGSITENTIQQLSEATQLLDVSETASEAWSTDVLASDSERMTEVDTDDTGSVARSDDTARSEIEVEGRVEPEGGEETPPSTASLNLNSGFRPIREDPVGRAGLVPPSPTRVDIAVHPVWNSTNRGKPDYRRRIAEYVDNTNNAGQRREPQDFKSAEDSPRLIHVIDKMDKPPEQKTGTTSFRQSATSIVNVPSPLVLIPNGPSQLIPNGTLPQHSNGPVPLAPNRSTQPLPNVPFNHIPLNSSVINPQPLGTSNSAPMSPLVGPTSMQNTSGQSLQQEPKLSRDVDVSAGDCVDGEVKREILVEDDTMGRDGAVGESMMNTVRLSSASLASSSSSGSSSDPRPKTATPTPVMNGHAVMPEGENRLSKSAVQPPMSSSSTGAIPKSISFDKTAERGDKDLLDDDSKHKRGFFRNIKLAFKPRRGKSVRSDDSRYEPLSADTDLPHRLRRMSEEAHSTRHDTTEDILAKYRRKPSTSSETTASETLTEPLNPIKVKQQCEDRLTIDPRNVEASDAFADAKRKLRMVLSTADLQHAPWNFQRGAQYSPRENDLVSFLQLQLAEAINLQDHSLISHLHETLRCIRLFDDKGCCKLFQSLHDDYQKRSPYIAYLVRSRKGLLSTLAHFERLTERVKKDHNVCSKFLIAVCVTLFLEKREGMMLQFQEEFQQLTVADEKTDLLDNFLQTLAIEMERDPTWQAASESQLEQARAAVERSVMGRVYIQALYPNGDGDISRDQVLHDHMKKLSNVITPNHKDLRIPKRYHYECPWPSAQAEITAIAAYKTPRDKLQCVFRCATTIMNLLAMAWEGSVPAADDFVPVLVYVLIKANPPSLLSTVQYVDSFYGSRLEGEEQYWWIQFCSAIEFIKTMDYGD